MSEPASIERTHRPIALDASTKDAPVRLFFGGSFDPPHNAHVSLAISVAVQLGSKCPIIFVPTARSPHKESNPTSEHHRLAMFEILLSQMPWLPSHVWHQELIDAELNPGHPSYWADTWAIVNQQCPTGANRFLIGADQALSMHRWHRYTEFWKDAAVILRGEIDSIDLLIKQLDETDVWSEDELEKWRLLAVETPMIDISSTTLRDWLKNPKTRELETPGLCTGVHEYILRNGLYQ